MSLKRLCVHSLRNLQRLDMQPSPAVNLIFGENGSGKTSILEAINVLTLGRSFRSHKIKALINEHQPQLTVFGHIDNAGLDTPLGVSRGRDNQSVFKAYGRPVGSAAELAGFLPLQVINADAFLLLEGSPKIRRQFLDWLVFHVEPSFFSAWKGAQRCLKHRNTILRRGRIEASELAAWEQELITLTEVLDDLRSRSFAVFVKAFEALVQDFIAIEGLSLSLYRGWDKTQTYREHLSDVYERDIKQGFTGSGFHRCDIRIRIKGLNAADVLSRGQQKLLVCAFKIAQGVVFAQQTGRRCVYLLDDLPAELDYQHRLLLVDWLERLETQVFITGVERDALLEPWREKTTRPIKVFHVERGEITNEEVILDAVQP